MEKLKLKKVKVADLVPAERNCRRHSQIQVSELARSLKEFGQTRPFVIDERNVVLVGNGMLAAMQSAGIDTAEAYVVSGWDEPKKRKLILADNRCYELGSTDIDTVFSELKALGDGGVFDVPGFDAEAIQRLCDSVCESALHASDYKSSYQAHLPDSSTHGADAVVGTASGIAHSVGRPASMPETVSESAEPEAVIVRHPDGAPDEVVCPYCGKTFPRR